MDMELQNRTKSILFWIGLVSCVYEAIINSLMAAGIEFPTVTAAILGAIGVALSTVLIYCNGNNPCMRNRY